MCTASYINEVRDTTSRSINEGLTSYNPFPKPIPLHLAAPSTARRSIRTTPNTIITRTQSTDVGTTSTRQTSVLTYPRLATRKRTRSRCRSIRTAFDTIIPWTITRDILPTTTRRTSLLTNPSLPRGFTARGRSTRSWCSVGTAFYRFVSGAVA